LSQELLTLAGGVFANNLPARRTGLLQAAMVVNSQRQVLTMQLAAEFTLSLAGLHFSACC